MFVHFAECLRFALADFYVSCTIAELACHLIEVIGTEYHVLHGQHAEQLNKKNNMEYKLLMHRFGSEDNHF